MIDIKTNLICRCFVRILHNLFTNDHFSFHLETLVFYYFQIYIYLYNIVELLTNYLNNLNNWSNLNLQTFIDIELRISVSIITLVYRIIICTFIVRLMIQEYFWVLNFNLVPIYI